MRWYKFNFDDYWTEIYGLADAEDLAYRRLMDLYYQTEGPLVADPDALEREVGLDWECIEPVLLRFFVHKDGTHWMHRTWQADIDRRKHRSQLNAAAGKIGGKAKRLRKKVEQV